MRSSDYLEKYKKLVKVLRVLCRVGYWGSAVLVIVLIPLAVLLATHSEFVLRYFLSENLHWGYTNEFIRYNLSMVAGKITPQEMRTIIMHMMLSIVVYSAVFGTTLFYLSGLLASVEKGIPFSQDNARRISSIGLIFLGGSLFVGVSQASTANVIIHALGLTDAITVNYSANTTMILTGLLMLILSSIFRYGSYLQEEYDATL